MKKTAETVRTMSGDWAVVFSVLLVSVGLGSCFAEEPEGLAPAQPANVTVEFDLFHRPLPDIPLPNDIATRYDPTSATGRRINASMLAPTQAEERTRRLLDQLDGFSLFGTITIPFTGPLDIQSIVDAHRDIDYDLSNDVVYLINVDRDSPYFGEISHVDVGEGNYPHVLERMDLWKNDPRGWTLTLTFEEADEDVNGNGVLDQGEDTNRNGVLDSGEDTDGDGELDPPEDSDADGVLDRPNYLPGHNPDSDDLGARSDALMTFYESETDTLVIRPLVPLRERTTYAVVVTRRLLDAEGSPVGSPFAYINHVSQNQALEPLEEVLPAGLSLSDIAFTFTYTTQTAESDWIAVREGLYGVGIQSHIGEQYPAELDQIFPLLDTSRGIQWPNPHILYTEQWAELIEILANQVYGIDPSSAQFADMLTAHEYIDYHVVGSFQSPQLFMREDENGVPLPYDEQSWPNDLTREPAPTRSETVYFWLTVPREEVSVRGDGQQAPVVILGHGYTSNRFEALFFSGYFAKHGLATLAIDCVSHGLEIPPEEEATYRELTATFGFEPFFDAMMMSRANDLNNDGMVDSAGDFWTAYVFHTRDVVRQSLLDYHQLVRIINTWDGELQMDFDLDGDGVNELAGDFNADGIVDIGADSILTVTGGSLGGIMALLMAGTEPDISAAVPIAGGGGLVDIGIRSKQGGVVEAVALRLMTPIYIATLSSETGLTRVETIIPDLNDDATLGLAEVDGIMIGDTVLVENLANGEVDCGYMSSNGKARIGVESDVGDLTRITFYRGPSIVPGTECVLVDGAQSVAVVDSFGLEVEFQGEIFEVGTPLVSLAEGMALARATPEFRRFTGIAQMVVDPADPAIFARYIQQESLVYPNMGGSTQTNTIVVTTMGDMNVPANSGVAIGRAAGFVDYLGVDERYGVSANQMLLDTYTVEAVNTLKRYVSDASGDGIHIDVENFSQGTDLWGDDVPRLDPPLRLYSDTDRDGNYMGGFNGSIFPLPVPGGAHGFPFPGEMVDWEIEACEAACETEDCGCSDEEYWDTGRYLFNMFGLFMRSGGTELDDDMCNAFNSCEGFITEAPPRRSLEELFLSSE